MEGIMVGYGDYDYRIYIPKTKKVHICQDVKFDDEKLQQPVQKALDVNNDGAEFSNEDDGDKKDPEADEFAVEDSSEADVTSPRSPRGVNGGTPVRPRVVMPTPVPTTPRRQLHNHNMIHCPARHQNHKDLHVHERWSQGKVWIVFKIR